jgi:putative cardiolipin synthase
MVFDMKAFLLALPMALLISCCHRLPTDYPRKDSTALQNTSGTRLANSFAADFKSHAQVSAFYPLMEGKDALIARIATIRAADKTLDVQYYIWHDDLTGNILLHELMQAADRGVRVRLLLDDLNEAKLNETLTILDSHPNIEVRMSNPLMNRTLRFLDLWRFTQIQRRMHNKALIADNVVAIVGGRNVGDEYFSASKEMNFGDFDVWSAGPVTAEISKEFDLYWNNKIAVPVNILNEDVQVTPAKLTALKDSLKRDFESAKTGDFSYSVLRSDLERNFEAHKLVWYWAPSRAIFDSPKKLDDEKAEQTKSLKQKMNPLLDGAKRELVIVSSYYVPGDAGVQELAEKVAEGVKTTVFTNSLASNDVIGAFAGYRDYRKKLIKAGVALYELKPDANMTGVRKKLIGSGSRTGLHGKFYIKDRKEILIGSMNLDPRSLKYNTEMGIVIDSPELAAKVAGMLESQLPSISYHLTLDKNEALRWVALQKDQQPIVFESEPEVSFWTKLGVETLDLIVPEDLL